jgi:hypothetical protein
MVKMALSILAEMEVVSLYSSETQRICLPLAATWSVVTMTVWSP